MAPPWEWYKLVSKPEIAKKSINPLFWRSRSSKFIEFGGNREPVYDSLLVINSNLGPIAHHYWDTASYWLKIAKFFTPSYIAFSFGVTPSNLWKSLTVPETRVFPAADGEDLVILACTVFDWSTRVIDRQTDGRTDRRTNRTAMAETRA